MLARARRTESFHGYRDFQTVGLSRSVERAVPENGDAGVMPGEATWAAEGTSPGPEGGGAREAAGGPEAHRPAAEAVPESKRRSAEDENENRAELKKKGCEGAGFLGRKKGPYLASSPSTSDGGTDSPGTASPSPTKTTPSPRHRKSDSSGPEYSL